MSEQNNKLNNVGKKTLLLTCKSSSDSKVLSEAITNFKSVRIYLTVNSVHTSTMEFDVEDIIYASNGYQWHHTYYEGSGYYSRFRFSFVNANSITIHTLAVVGWNTVEAKIYGIK